MKCLCIFHWQWTCASFCDPKSCHLLGVIVRYTLHYTTLYNILVWFTLFVHICLFHSYLIQIRIFFSQPCVSYYLSCACLLWRTKVSSVTLQYIPICEPGLLLKMFRAQKSQVLWSMQGHIYSHLPIS